MPVTRASLLLRTRQDRHDRIAGAGDTIEGAGTIAGIEAHAADGSTLAVLARLTDDRRAVARWRDGSLRRVLTDGDSVRAGTVVLDGPGLAMRGRTIAVEGGLDGPDDNAGGLVLVTRAGVVRAVQAPRRGRFAGLAVEDLLFTSSRLLAFGNADEPGLFAVRRGRFRPLHGARRRGSASGDIQIAATDGERLVAVRSIDERASVQLLQPGPPVEIGRLPAVPSALAVRGEVVVALVSFVVPPDDRSVTQLVALREGTVTPVVTRGAPSPIGTIEDIGELAVVGDRVVFTARLGGDGVRHAVLAADLP